MSLDYRVLPIVDMYDLEASLKEAYNEEFDLARLFYDYDDMVNEACQEYHFKADIESSPMANILEEDELRQLKLVNTYLELYFPNYSSIMVYSHY